MTSDSDSLLPDPKKEEKDVEESPLVVVDTPTPLPTGHEQVIEKSSRTSSFLEAINPKLAEIRRPWKAYCIVAFVVVTNLLFLFVMTSYNWVYACTQQVIIMDADWSAVPSALDIGFEPYDFDPPNYLCISYTASDWINATGDIIETVYDVPCLLGNLTCENYGDTRCPEVFQTGQSDYLCNGLEPGQELYNCADYENPFVSVVSMQCLSFFASLGLALPYVFYLQIVLFAIGYCFYRCCCYNDDEDEDTTMLSGIKDVMLHAVSRV